MKRSVLLRHLRKYGCHLKREGGAHSLWINPATGSVEAIPRHTEIPDRLAQKICRNLSLPLPGS
ncbi:MAG: type II toxin-antitoxin system HicA family toxin [Nitrospira sp. SB0666_bin_27]|nr:type II toxin-antitoxin system HicA family toxin [Nitrospira sp. SB0666_bin_27]MYA29144.1 type II toxin-antitoxin system HicA family toxin [Nitrospira sp. SB0666_bin_27]MYF24706.1 type II toxin-antitoxin system HicA family toxin [Nitrospira sp. SB0678_bin_10]